MTPLVYKEWASRSTSSRRGFCCPIFLFITVTCCLYQGEAYSHQWPRCGERFLGRYTPGERFRGRLREWRLGELDPRCCEGSCKRFPTVRPGSGMSTTVGGRSQRSKAAASGRAVSITSRVGQRVDDSRPLPSSFPCLSCGISQMLPRRQSREGLGRGLLKSR